jgi:uncharacterized protein (TIGR03067 family)
MGAKVWGLSLAGLFLFGVAWAAQDAAKEDQEKLQGRWTVIRGEDSGEQLPEQRIKDSDVVIRGDRIRVKSDREPREMAFKLAPTKNPKTIDMTIMEGPEKGKTAYGIYRLEGDVLTIAFAPVGKERPKNFETKQGSKEMMFVMKREKP